VLKNKKIGFIGCGNMARALISGLLHGNHAKKTDLCASNHKEEKAKAFEQEFGIFTTLHNPEVVKRSDIVVFAVKPQVLDRVLQEVAQAFTGKKLAISIAAGVPMASIQKRLPPNNPIVRVMPNITAIVGAGMSALATCENTNSEDLQFAKAIFDSVGKTVVVEEDQLDAVTGLSGSGPAYIFLIIDALADAGVKVGLSRDTSLLLAAQTVLGSAKLLIETAEHPGKLKDMVTSPGGTAIAGIHTLEEGGLRTTLINAVERATHRARELGLKFKSPHE